jgi:hypothetical protein
MRRLNETMVARRSTGSASLVVAAGMGPLGERP